MTAKGLTLARIRATWPPTVPVGQAATALGVSRSSAYEGIRRGDFPVKTISVGHRVVVLTADLIRVLEGGGDDAAA
jgi:Helix-turn-helix domain